MKHTSSTQVASMSICVLALSALGAPAQKEVLPKPEAPFKGKIGRTAKDSKPDFPKGVTAPAGAPNILMILTDDVGFGASSTFGGPIQTPNFQRLADALGADHRSQPPFKRKRRHHRNGHRLPGLQLAYT